MKIEEKFIGTKYGKICYLEIGEGKKTIVFIHGILGDPFGLSFLISPLTLRGYKIIFPYLPGHGKSFKLPRQFGFAQVVETIKEFVDKIVSGNFTVVGWSYGGAVAWEIANKFNKRVDKLILHAPLIRGVPAGRVLLPPIGLVLDYIKDSYWARGRSKVASIDIDKWIIKTSPREFFKSLYRLILNYHVGDLALDPKKVLIIWGQNDLASPYFWTKPVLGSFMDKILFIPGGHMQLARRSQEFIDSQIKFLDTMQSE